MVDAGLLDLCSRSPSIGPLNGGLEGCFPLHDLAGPFGRERKREKERERERERARERERNREMTAQLHG